MKRVIISHGQTSYLPSFYTSCVQNTVVVLDAPTVGDTYLCKIHGYNTVLMPKRGNRSANRNAGLSYIMDQYPDTDIVEFLDGIVFPNRTPHCIHKSYSGVQRTACFTRASKIPVSLGILWGQL